MKTREMTEMRFSARHHPDLEITGLSATSGGWLARRPFRFEDPVYPGAFPKVQHEVRARLEALHEAGRIRLATLPRPYLPPRQRGAGTLPADRVKGILYGAAIGDALGNTSESMRPSQRLRLYGEIRHYLPNKHAAGIKLGLPSDDTQLTVWTLESLLEHGQPDLAAIADTYAGNRIYGIGRTMSAFLETHRGAADPWDARQHSAGNGALMRVAGAFLPHAWTLDPGMPDTIALTSALTHDHAASTAACIALAHILADLLYSGGKVHPGYFWERFVEIARELEGDSELTSRVPGDDYRGPLWSFVADRVPAALWSGQSAVDACNQWRSGAYLLETVPSILMLLEHYHDDPEEAIVRAVMDTWDNDTIATVVGAVVGAIHGFDALPKRWVRDLSGRTGSDDDGRLERAYRRLREFGGTGLRD